MPSNAITFLLTGMVFGLSAGISPGPLLTLVISETLRHNIRAGIRVAVAPLATDAPIVLCTFFVLSRLADVQPLLGIISLLGGIFIAYIARQQFEIWRTDRPFLQGDRCVSGEAHTSPFQPDSPTGAIHHHW